MRNIILVVLLSIILVYCVDTAKAEHTATLQTEAATAVETSLDLETEGTEENGTILPETEEESKETEMILSETSEEIEETETASDTLEPDHIHEYDVYGGYCENEGELWECDCGEDSIIRPCTHKSVRCEFCGEEIDK